MKKLLAVLFGLGLLSMALMIAPPLSVPVARAQVDDEETLVLDVACDGRTFRLNQGNPAATDFARGDSFIVNGTIYPGGTIPAGGTPENPVFSPDERGAIGGWICRGTFMVDAAQAAAGAVPHLDSTQTYYLKPDGTALVSEGLEGGVPTIRSVLGGMMQRNGAAGQVYEEEIGVNRTGFPNFRFTFKLKKQAPR